MGRMSIIETAIFNEAQQHLATRAQLPLVAPPHHCPPPSRSPLGNRITAQHLSSTDFCNTICHLQTQLLGYLYWPPKVGSDWTWVTGGGFHWPVSASDLGA
jgi:hypothetical protein